MSKTTGTEARVCADIAGRQQLGIRKYGATLDASSLSLRDTLIHAYHEKLDAAIYTRSAIAKIEQGPEDTFTECAVCHRFVLITDTEDNVCPECCENSIP